jgi:hypothetical protein
MEVGKAQRPAFLATHGAVPTVQQQQSIPLGAEVLERRPAGAECVRELVNNSLDLGEASRNRGAFLIASGPHVTMVATLEATHGIAVTRVAEAGERVIGALTPKASE